MLKSNPNQYFPWNNLSMMIRKTSVIVLLGIPAPKLICGDMVSMPHLSFWWKSWPDLISFLVKRLLKSIDYCTMCHRVIFIIDFRLLVKKATKLEEYLFRF